MYELLPKHVTFNLTKKVNQSPWNVKLESKGPNFARKVLQRPLCINSSILKAVHAEETKLFVWTDGRTGRKQYPIIPMNVIECSFDFFMKGDSTIKTKLQRYRDIIYICTTSSKFIENPTVVDIALSKTKNTNKIYLLLTLTSIPISSNWNYIIPTRSTFRHIYIFLWK